MKVAIVVSEINVRGGTHKQVLRLCQYLEKHGIEFSLLTKYYEPDKSYPEFENYEVLYVKEKPSEWDSNATFFQKLKLLWERLFYEEYLLFRKIPKGTNIVNIHDNRLFAFAFLSKVLRRAKLVWQINDLPYSILHGRGEGKRNIDAMVEDFFIHQTIQRADEISVNVTKNAQRVREKMGRDAHVFYCGVDVNDALKPHTYPGVEKKPIRLLSTGVFFPYRNYESLVLAVEQLRERGYDAHLDIIGSTEVFKPYADTVCQLIREKDLQEHVSVWGQVDEETYARLYNEADQFMFLNIDQSWGLAVFEAMSCGLPVLVSNSVGAIELLEHDQTAAIMDPKDIDVICDTVIKLATDGDYYTKLSQNASAAVKEFTWDKLYNEKMLSLFHKLEQNKK